MKKSREIWKMGSINVIPMELKHIEDVLIIDSSCFAIHWSRESFMSEVLQNKLARYVVAVLDDKIIGYAGMWLIADEAQITNIATHPEYRGKGAASSMLEAMLAICKKEKISSITLEVRISNITALNLYKKYRFSQEGLRKQYYADNKEDAIIMWKRNI
jgi:ribosomal-protein-alanine N-acetyltransferase